MKPDLHNKPRVTQTWLRVLLFCVFYFSLSLVAGLLLGIFQHPSLPGGDKSPAPAGVPYLMFIVSALISFAAVWICCTLIDRRRFESIGFTIAKSGAHAGTGFFLGIALLCIGSCILFFTKNLVWTDISFNGNDLFLGLGLMVIIAFSEEIVFRGYILNNLLESGNRWMALLISALIFALAHLANPDFSVVAAINIFLAGIVLGINYAYTKNLWFSIMLHFTWNFFQGPILGYDVSGMHLQSLLQHDIQGSPLLTGGSFGFEGSLIATVLLIMSAGGLWWVYEKKYMVRTPEVQVMTVPL